MLKSISILLSLSITAVISAAIKSSGSISHHAITSKQPIFNSYADLENFAVREMNLIQNRYGKKKLEKREIVSQNLTDENHDTGYLVSLQVGTPPKNYFVTLDTGSSDLVLATSPCIGCTVPPPLYSPLASSTYSLIAPFFKIVYGSGSAQGNLVQDLVSIAGLAPITQSFGSVTSATGIVDHVKSGILGLGTVLGSVSGSIPLIQGLAGSGVLDQPMFGISLKRLNSIAANASTISSEGGSLTLGGTDSSLYPNSTLNYITVFPNTGGHWFIPLDSIYFGNRKTTGSNNVVIDTGTTLIAVPKVFASAFYATVPGSQPVVIRGQSGLYSIPCDSNLEPIAFVFGGIVYNMNLEDFIFKPTAGGVCLGAFFVFESVSNIDWIIGAAFLKNVYSSFRFLPIPAVGFASTTKSTAFNFTPQTSSLNLTQTNNTVSTSPAVNSKSKSSGDKLSSITLFNSIVAVLVVLYNV